MSEKKPDADLADKTPGKKNRHLDANDDETRILKRRAKKSTRPVETGSGRKGSATEVGAERKRSSARADETIIRGSADRSPPAPDGKTKRQKQNHPSAVADKTIIRGSADRSPDAKGQKKTQKATILRGGVEKPQVARPAAADATVIRTPDDDSTIINTALHDDATILGSARTEADTTFIATLNKSHQSRGNTEAGRLLKNRFVLEEKIGSGGMGDVYKALDLRLQEAKERNPYIAIKILNESFAQHKDAFVSLQRETTRMRSIPHPHIMAVHDFDKEGDTVFMCMELLEGGKPLDDYLKEHQAGVSEDEARNIIDGICQGLGRAHDAGIVHSDFKPGNIFYCADKTAKVFDFGIARKVSNPGDIETDGEKTVFDAGSLGALTPTYASYEMLKGLAPTKSDDIYAVALVAYELFTGKHPYNRVPADKALERGLKPEPIRFLKRRHWRVLKKGLELKSKDRTQSLEEFRQGLFSEDPKYFRYGAVAALLVASVSFGVYQQFFKEQMETPAEFTEYNSAFQNSNVEIGIALGEPVFDNVELWQEPLRINLARMQFSDVALKEEKWAQFTKASEAQQRNNTIADVKIRIMSSYLGEVRRLRENAVLTIVDETDKTQVEQGIKDLEQAKGYLEIVRTTFNFDPALLSLEDGPLIGELKVREYQLDKIGEAEIAKIAKDEADEAQAEKNKRIEEAIAAKNNQYALYSGELRAALLRCKGDISQKDMVSIETTIKGMSGTDPAKFELDKPGIVAAFVGCIERRIAISKPSRAREVKRLSLTYLPGESKLEGIEIVDLDPCAARELVGAGSRNRSRCRDKLSAGGTGPELVVIPRKPGIAPTELFGQPYATSRMEIRIGDYNHYCENSGCLTLDGSSSLPVTNITLEQARQYVAWLSSESGRDYSLPTTEQWLYAASTSGNESVDQNVNCTVDARGVRLGEKLLNTLSGRPNSWGLYNYVGNAREWAINGEDIFALGGAHTDPKSECRLSKSVAHSGLADAVTGFRVVRKI